MGNEDTPCRRREALFVLKHRYSVLALAGLGIATYGRAACLPALLGDEWGRMYAICHGIRHGHTLNPFLRPFLAYWHRFLHLLWGINVVGYRWTSLFLVVLGAVALYMALESFLPRRRPFNLLVASLFLVYPSGYPHLFFERGTYQLGLALMLFSYAAMGHGLAEGARFRRTALCLAVVGTVLSLLLYEAHIGLAALLSVLALLRSGRQPASRRWVASLPFVMAIIFALGRWRSQLAVGSIYGYTTDHLALSPRLLATRLMRGYECSLVRCWSDGVQWLTPTFRSIGGMGALLLGMGVVVAVGVALRGRRKRHLSAETSVCGLPVSLREYLALGGFSLLAIAAGYVPMLFGLEPSLSFMVSRINIIPSAGAALLMALGVAALVTVLRLRAISATSAFLALSFPLVALGGIVQVMSQDLAEQGWMEQKLIYRQMVALAPDLAPDTEVLLILAPYRTSEESRICAEVRPFESGPWGFRAALSLLYGHRVRGSFHYCAAEVLQFSAEGVFLPYTETLRPYDGTVVMVYDRRKHKLTFLENGGVGLPAYARPGLARSRTLVLPTSAPHAPWRFLMQ
jgi:hypothetical protein